MKIPGFWIFSLLDYESESAGKISGKFGPSRKCSLLLWLVRAQHDHYKSECQRESEGICLPFHCESATNKKKIGFISNRFRADGRLLPRSFSQAGRSKPSG